MDLTFQVPMQYCSLRHWTLRVPSPVTSTTGCCFCFGPVSSSFLELFLYSSPVAYWVSTVMGSSFQCLIFLPFHTVHGVLEGKILKWFDSPFSSGSCLSELSSTTCPSWVALQGMAQSCIELDKAVIHVISLVSFL